MYTSKDDILKKGINQSLVIGDKNGRR
jgi:hypothetical protein